jgi:multiple sugar transport system permease protein
MIKRKNISSIIINIVMVILACIWLYPYLWMFFASIKENDTIFTSGLLGGKFTISNYIFLYKSAVEMGRPFFRALGNSFFITIVTTASVMLTSCIIAYALAKLEFKGREKIKSFLIFQMIFPSFMFIIPLFILIRSMNLLNTYSAMIIPSMMSGWAIFMLTQSFKATPDAYMEAAKIDGAGDFWIIFKVMAPLNKSIILLVGLFTFYSVWNNFMWPLIVVKDYDLMPLSVLLAAFNHEYGAYVGPLMAGTIMQTLPILIIFLIFRKYFLDGISVSLK